MKNLTLKLTAFLCLAVGMASAANHLNNVGVLVDDTGASVLALYGFTTGTPHTNNFGFLIDDTGALVVTGISSSSGDALVANPLSQFAATTSAQLAATISNETGTGLAVFGTGPTITLPNATALPEGGLSTTDITTNNATTSKHGFLLKLDNTATHYMDGTGAWSTPASGVTWDAITNAAGALTLANGTNASTFNQTSAANWTWANTTAASSGTAQSSPIFNINGKVWHAAASTTDTWTVQDVIANGTDGSANLTFGHSGTIGDSKVVFPANPVGGGTGGGPALAFVSNLGTGIGISGSNQMAIYSGGGLMMRFLNPWADLLNTGGYCFTDFGANNDTCRTRISANLSAMGTRSQGDTTGSLRLASIQSAGTKFSSNAGCTEGTLVGGATAGKFTVGQGTACTVVITMGDSATAPNGWACAAYDQTGVPAVAIRQTASNTTTASLLMTVTTSDVVTFQCIGY